MNNREPKVALDDLMFKNISKTESGLALLKKIIEFVIEEEIIDIELLNPEIMIPNIYVKGKTMDFIVRTNNKKIMIEANNSNSEYVRRRNFCYYSGKYSAEVRRGGDYDDMDEYIQLNFSRDSLSGKALDLYQMKNEEGDYLYVNNFKIYEFDIEIYYKNRYNESVSDVEKYLASFLCKSEELEEMEENKIIKDFRKELDRINNDKEYNDWLTLQEDEERRIQTELENAKRKSKLDGEISKQLEIARNMIKETDDFSFISRVTGLSIEEIEKLK